MKYLSILILCTFKLSYAADLIMPLSKDYTFVEHSDENQTPRLLDSQTALKWASSDEVRYSADSAVIQDAIVIRYSIIASILKGEMVSSDLKRKLLTNDKAQSYIAKMPNTVARRVNFLKDDLKETVSSLSKWVDTLLKRHKSIEQGNESGRWELTKVDQSAIDDYFQQNQFKFTDFGAVKFENFRYDSTHDLVKELLDYEKLKLEVLHLVASNKLINPNLEELLLGLVEASKMKSILNLQILSLDLMRLDMSGAEEAAQIESQLAILLFDHSDWLSVLSSLKSPEAKNGMVSSLTESSIDVGIENDVIVSDKPEYIGTETDSEINSEPELNVTVDSQSAFADFRKAANARLFAHLSVINEYLYNLKIMNIDPASISSRDLAEVFRAKQYPEATNFFLDPVESTNLFFRMGPIESNNAIGDQGYRQVLDQYFRNFYARTFKPKRINACAEFLR